MNGKMMFCQDPVSGHILIKFVVIPVSKIFKTSSFLSFKSILFYEMAPAKHHQMLYRLQSLNFHRASAEALEVRKNLLLTGRNLVLWRTNKQDGGAVYRFLSCN